MMNFSKTTFFEKKKCLVALKTCLKTRAIVSYSIEKKKYPLNILTLNFECKREREKRRVRECLKVDMYGGGRKSFFLQAYKNFSLSLLY